MRKYVIDKEKPLKNLNGHNVPNLIDQETKEPIKHTIRDMNIGDRFESRSDNGVKILEIKKREKKENGMIVVVCKEVVENA